LIYGKRDEININKGMARGRSCTETKQKAQQNQDVTLTATSADPLGLNIIYQKN